jgi:transcriptional regulator with XRE-family HTH domain
MSNKNISLLNGRGFYIFYGNLGFNEVILDIGFQNRTVCDILVVLKFRGDTMTVGEKIRIFRLEKNLTQKELAIMCRYSESAIRNYELGNRTPNIDQLQIIADALQINVYALADPSIDTYTGAIHTLFSMEDEYGLHPITAEDGQIYLTVDSRKGGTLQDSIIAWGKMYEKLRKEDTSMDEYQKWKTKYPLTT